MRSIAVYKTDVTDRSKAKTIVDAIHRQCPDCEASFDLEDCDKVLRVESKNGKVEESEIRDIFKNYGYQLESLL